MKVPFNLIKEHYLDQKQEIDQAIAAVLESGNYIGGEKVRSFENAFSSYHGTEHAVGCASGTDALYLALKALGIGPGDEVITTAFSWISTATAISQTGAKPVFVDIESEDLQMSLSLAEKAITSKTKAILPVYLYGNTKRRAAYIAFATKFELALVEDAAQVHGIPLGLEKGFDKHLICFSFYPTKQLGAFGDAGAVTTDDSILASELRALSNMGGMPDGNDFEKVGINSRLDPIQAVVLSTRLNHIEIQLQRRLELANVYDQFLSDQFQKPEVHDQHTLYQYVIQCSDRIRLTQYLDQHEIGHGVHYGYTLPGTAVYGSRSGFPVAEQAAKQVVSLPIDPKLTEEQIAYVCQVLNQITD